MTSGNPLRKDANIERCSPSSYRGAERPAYPSCGMRPPKKRRSYLGLNDSHPQRLNVVPSHVRGPQRHTTEPSRTKGHSDPLAAFGNDKRELVGATIASATEVEHPNRVPASKEPTMLSEKEVRYVIRQIAKHHRKRLSMLFWFFPFLDESSWPTSFLVLHLPKMYTVEFVLLNSLSVQSIRRCFLLSLATNIECA